MTPVAEIRLSGRSGVFVATAARLDGVLLHAEGRWRRRGGANNGNVRFSDERAYSWPVAAVQQVRWLDREQVK